MTYELVARKVAPVAVGFIGTSIDAGTLVQTKPTDVFAELAGVTVCNRAVSGSTSTDWVPGGPHYSAAKAAFLSAGVGLVHIMLGTNDAKTSVSTSPAAYRANLLAICDDLQASGMRVVISYPPYLGATTVDFDAGSPARVAAYCYAIDSITGGRIIRGDTLAQEYFKITGLMPDLVHPIESGSVWLGHLWDHALSQVITELSAPIYELVAIGPGLSLSVVDGVPALALLSGGEDPPPPPPPEITWSQTDKNAAVTVSESDALATKAAGNGWVSARSSMAFATGGASDLECEIEIVGDTQVIVGVMKLAASLSNFVGGDALGYGYYASNGTKANSGGLAAYGTACSVGDRVTVRLTAGGVLSFELNGVPMGDAFSGLSGEFMVAISVYTGSTSGGRIT